MTNKEAIKLLQQIYPNGGHCWLDEQRLEAINMAIEALKSTEVSDDLEEAAIEAFKKIVDSDKNSFYEIFKAGAEWMKQRDNKPVSNDLKAAADEYTNAHYQIFNEYHYEFGDIVDDIVNDKEDVNLAFKAGANWMKAKLMKDAMEAAVTGIRVYKEENEVDFTIMLEKGIIPYEIDEEVKLVIVKDD